MATQLAGAAIAACVVLAAARRAGLRTGLATAAAFAALLFLTAASTGVLRESWHALDLLRSRSANVTPEAGRYTCTGLGLDPKAVAWVASEIPEHARFYAYPTGALVSGGGACLGFILLPRLRVAHLSQAHYVLFWDTPGNALLESLRRRGATIFTFKSIYHVARLPGA